jgi:hypothetical protein
MQKASEVKWDQYWNPKINVANGIGELKSKVTYSLNYDGNGRATVVEIRKVGGTFFEFMELNKFPFDSQVVTSL